MVRIYLPIGFISDDFAKAQAYCNHYNCTIHKPAKGSPDNCIESESPVNFFWLGANLNLRSESSLTITAAEKYLDK